MSYNDTFCGCGRGYYNSDQYSSCYDCYRARIADLMHCIFCGKLHSQKFSTCFECRVIPGRDEAAKDLRVDILMRDAFVCQNCGTAGHSEIDHIKPCARGGTAVEWNLHTLCRECNQDKGKDWWPGCKWEDMRNKLIHMYLTFGWTYLDPDKRELLLSEAVANWPEFGWHTRLSGKRDVPQWAIEMAESA